MVLRKIHFTNRNQVLSQFLFGLAQTPWLAAAARYPTNHGPRWLREAIARQKRKHKRLGYAMAPQRELRAVYRRGLGRLIEKVGRSGLGDYLEFGVHSCTTMLCMYRELEAMSLKHVRLFGFDSFAGLPVSHVADDVGTWAPGAYKSDYEFAEQILKDEKVDPARVLLTPGFFGDTLTPDFPSRHRLSKASAIMIDCDQYLGANEALTFSRALIKDHALVLFDDWNSQNLAARNLGQKRAFDEFLAAGEFMVEPMQTYTGNARVFFVSRRG